MKKQSWLFSGSDRWICTGCALAEDLRDISEQVVTVCHHKNPEREDGYCNSRKLSKEFTDEFRSYKKDLIKRYGVEMTNEILKKSKLDGEDEED